MIEEKNDLMKNIGSGENNLRKYLMIGGGVFVLFVIGVVSAKFLFSKPKDDTKVILPNEIQVDKKDDTKMFNDIPIEKDTTTPQFKKPEVKETQAIQPETAKTQPTQPETKNITPVEVTETKKPKPQTKPVVEETKPKKTKPVKKVAKKGHYYIQVAAVTRGNPSKSFLKLIKKNGFNYKIVEVNVKGMKIKRVLVGPFTKTEAKKALVKVRKKLSSSAFIKRLK